MCVKTIGAVSTALADVAEQPAAPEKPEKKKKDEKATMNSLKEERLERLAREWVPHPTYWGGDPMLVPWVFPEWPE